MKKVLLFIGLSAYFLLVNGIGFDSRNPGNVVNGSDRSGEPKLSLYKEWQDQWLTVPVYIEGGKKCTGTLVGDKYVLTAKSCFSNELLSVLNDHEWSEIPIVNINEAVEVIVYTSPAYSSFSMNQYGRVYKFSKFRAVLKEFTPFSIDMMFSSSSTSYVVGRNNYERLHVTDIDTLGRDTDVILLTLEGIPDIIQRKMINPKEDIILGSYRNYFENAAKEETASGYTMPVRKLEVMGFGVPKMENILADQLGSEKLAKVGFNLRTNRPSISKPLSYNKAQNVMCLTNCFVHVFIDQGVDSGDTGAALSYIELIDGRKKIVGVVSSPGRVVFRNSNNIKKEMDAVIIQSLNKRDRDALDRLRKRS